ncbi:MAG: DUF5309 family protein [Firmicutes bacterium]|nr:DUF5309 family protein [Bacillota bacterium]
MTVRSTKGTYGLHPDRYIVDWSEEIYNSWPDIAPLLQFTGKSQRKPTVDPEYNWFEEAEGAVRDQINNAVGYDPAAVNLVVDHASYFAPYDRVLIERTGEIVLVTAVDTGTNTLTVIRGFGTVSAAAIQDNDYLMILDNAMPEGSGKPAQKFREPVKQYNYTQIFKTIIGATGTVIASEQRGPKELSHQRMIFNREHKKKIEYAGIFGQKKEYVAGDQIIRTTGGILEAIKTNVYNAGGVLTEANFDKEFVPMAFYRGSKKKLMLCSPLVLAVINSFSKNKLQTASGEETYGVSVQKYLTPFGTLLLAQDELLTGDVFGGYAIVVDFENVAYRPLRGRDTKLLTNVQESGMDIEQDMFMTEAGWQVKLEETHAVLKGVTG